MNEIGRADLDLWVELGRTRFCGFDQVGRAWLEPRLVAELRGPEIVGGAWAGSVEVGPEVGGAEAYGHSLGVKRILVSTVGWGQRWAALGVASV